MATYLITGSSRGLGLKMADILASKPATKLVIATSRSPYPPPALASLISNSSGRVVHIALDVLSDSSVASAVGCVRALLSRSQTTLDVLINNAGIQIFEEGGRATGMHALEESLATNVVAVHRVSAAFLPLLEAGKGKKLVNVSSTLGSIAWKEYSRPAPFPSYKVSKSALNSLTAQYAAELGEKGFTVVCVNPGWNRTDLGSQHADLDPQQGAGGVVHVVEGLTRDDNGRFRSIRVPEVEGKFMWNGHDMYDGKDQPW